MTRTVFGCPGDEKVLIARIWSVCWLGKRNLVQEKLNQARFDQENPCVSVEERFKPKPRKAEVEGRRKMLISFRSPACQIKCFKSK